jgi:hypothetical protein
MLESQLTFREVLRLRHSSRLCDVMTPILSAFLVFGLAAGQTNFCGAAPLTHTGRRIQVITGEGRALVLGSAASQTVVVEVVDGSGQPVPGVEVGFTFPSFGGPRGVATTGASFTTQHTDSRGIAIQHVRPSGQPGTWTLTASATGARRTSISLVNIMRPATLPVPQQNAPVTSAPRGSATSEKSGISVNPPNGHGLIYVLVAVGVAAAAGAGLGLKGGGGNTASTPGGAAVSTPLTISIGSGSFGTPGHH